MDKENGEPIFGFAGGESESLEDEQVLNCIIVINYISTITIVTVYGIFIFQNCLCARNYYEALQQGCKMTVPYRGPSFDQDYIVCIRERAPVFRYMY